MNGIIAVVVPGDFTEKYYFLSIIINFQSRHYARCLRINISHYIYKITKKDAVHNNIWRVVTLYEIIVLYYILFYAVWKRILYVLTFISSKCTFIIYLQSCCYFRYCSSKLLRFWMIYIRSIEKKKKLT